MNIDFSGPAALAANNAPFCVASRVGGTAIIASIGTGCSAVNGTNSIANKYNMP